jgi:hypothetical protein
MVLKLVTAKVLAVLEVLEALEDLPEAAVAEVGMQATTTIPLQLAALAVLEAQVLYFLMVQVEVQLIDFPLELCTAAVVAVVAAS